MGISRDRECAFPESRSWCDAVTALFWISSLRRKTERFWFISRFSRRLPVTGDAYAGTLQNRTCFNGETGWLRNNISVPEGRFFYTRKYFWNRKNKREEERMKVYKKLMNALATVEKIVLVISTLLISCSQWEMYFPVKSSTAHGPLQKNLLLRYLYLSHFWQQHCHVVREDWSAWRWLRTVFRKNWKNLQ